MATRNRSRWALAAAALSGCIALACNLERASAPNGDPPSLAPGGGGGPPVKVNAVVPNSGEQGTALLTVVVSGSGYDPSASVLFTLNGTPVPEVVTLQTRFIDEGTLEADVQIDATAPLDLYDVDVDVPGRGKKGSGADLFQVVEKGGTPGGNNSDTPVRVDFAGDDITNDGTDYLPGENGVLLSIVDGSGGLSFRVESPRAVYIGDIWNVAGDSLLLPAPGFVEPWIRTFACCDMRAMSADSAEGTIGGDGNPVHMKFLVGWSLGEYKLSYGSSRCRNFSSPDDDPLGGSWALVTMDTMSAAPDTVWTVESDGPATLCRFEDNRGGKNDSLVVISTSADAVLRMTATSQ